MATTINISGQIDRLNNVGYEIDALKRDIRSYQNNINSVWVSSEMRYLNEELNDIYRELADAGKELCGIEVDLIKAADEINEKERLAEEARAAAEAEALAKAAAEAGRKTYDSN